MFFFYESANCSAKFASVLCMNKFLRKEEPGEIGTRF